MDKIIIVEGPQGVGKTTLTNWLREKILFTNLYRLTGHSDAAKTGYEKSLKMYDALMKYIEDTEETGVNLLFDRTFTTEKVYCDLGIRDYNIDEIYHKYLKKMNKLNYDVYFINLYLKDEKNFLERIKREKKTHHSSKFSFENSKRQQEMYIKMFEVIKKKYPNIKCFNVAMDDYDEGYEEIRQILGID